jgi:hypothetical protein
MYSIKIGRIELCVPVVLRRRSFYVFRLVLLEMETPSTSSVTEENSWASLDVETRISLCYIIF